MTTTINADTIVGGAVITADTSGQLALQAAGNTVLTINSSRAIGVGASPSYGSSGQILTSAGSAAAPTWSAPAAVNLATGVTGTLPVANGGTGATTLTANNVLLGNGTSAVQVVAPSTNGNVLTSNGTTWVSQALPVSGVSQAKATAIAMIFGF